MVVTSVNQLKNSSKVPREEGANVRALAVFLSCAE